MRADTRLEVLPDLPRIVQDESLSYVVLCSFAEDYDFYILLTASAWSRSGDWDAEIEFVSASLWFFVLKPDSITLGLRVEKHRLKAEAKCLRHREGGLE